MLKTSLTALGLTATLAALPAAADPIFTDNFDAPGNTEVVQDPNGAGPDGNYRVFAQDWTVESRLYGAEFGAGPGTQSADPEQVTSGTRHLFLEVQDGSSTGLFIDTGADALAGDYTITFDTFARPGSEFGSTLVAELYAWDGTGSLSTDGTLIGSYTAINAVIDNPAANSATFSVGSSSTDNVFLRFGATTGAGAGYQQAVIDTVSVDFTAIPEPSSMALLGLGGLAALRRRKNG